MTRYGLNLPVLSTIRDYRPEERDLFICAIGAPKAKLAACEMLQARGGRFTNVIHPTVPIGPRSKVGLGVVITRSALVSVDVSLGDFVTVNCYASFGHDAVVENGCTINAHCDITGHAHLERGVLLGSHAAIMPGVRIGAFAVVGAGSVAFRDVKPGRTVIGVPAKVLL